MEIPNKNLDLYSSRYESNIIIGDLNVGVSDRHMNDFCNAYNFVGNWLVVQQKTRKYIRFLLIYSKHPRSRTTLPRHW